MYRAQQRLKRARGRGRLCCMIHVVSNIERRALHARHFVSLQFQTNPTALQSLKLTIARRLPYLHLFLGQGEPAYCAGVEGTPGPPGALPG